PPGLRPSRQPARLRQARPGWPRGRLHHGLPPGGVSAGVLPQGRGRERRLAPHRRPAGRDDHRGPETDARRGGAGRARLLRRADGQPPVLTAAGFPYVADLPQQAPNALINTYRELYWRIVDEVDKEFPGEARRRAQKVSTGILDAHKAIALLSAPRGAETPDAV